MRGRRAGPQAGDDTRGGRGRERRRTNNLLQGERRPVSGPGSRPGSGRVVAPVTGWALVREHLRVEDPAFSVVTLDRVSWIEPFTGRYVPLTGDVYDTARRLYRENPHLIGQEALPLSTLMELRWTYDIKRLLRKVSALRIFSPRGHCWLNPYTGILDSRVQLTEGQLTAETLRIMAKVLAECRQADGGAMLERTLLELRCREFGCVPKPITQTVSRTAPATTTAATPSNPPTGQAGAVQRHLLADLPVLPGYQLAVHYTTVEQVSSDLYEVMVLPDGRVRCFLGDITGHGMAGALLGATTIKALRMLTRTHLDTVDLLVQLNAELKSDLPPGQFLTLAVATLDPQTAILDCILAGHHPFVIANHDAMTPLRLAGSTGMAIGLVADDRFAAMLRPVSVDLQPGDVVLQYSDGLVESRNQRREEFGLGRLYAGLIGRALREPQEVVDGLARDVGRFTGGAVEDDLTILALGVERQEGTRRIVRREPTSEWITAAPVEADQMLEAMEVHETGYAVMDGETGAENLDDFPDDDVPQGDAGMVDRDGLVAPVTDADDTAMTDPSEIDAEDEIATMEDVPEPFGMEPDDLETVSQDQDGSTADDEPDTFDGNVTDGGADVDDGGVTDDEADVQDGEVTDSPSADAPGESPSEDAAAADDVPAEHAQSTFGDCGVAIPTTMQPSDTSRRMKRHKNQRRHQGGPND